MSFRSKILKNFKLQNVPDTDHRVIGARQNLYFFDGENSHGSCFYGPRGARIYNKLVEYLRDEYKRRGYYEVITPNMYHCRLWENSGHWEHYKENMIRFQLAESEYSLKPMNCPGHCLMFKYQDTKRSHELPVRWADFGVLHRNELSGVISGLTRARKFQQDDAHIFCTPEQVEDEVLDCLSFANDVYGNFGFSFDLELSLRPEKYLGSSELWDEAEQSLRVALQKSSIPWVERKFEGAFYGPKIDMIVKDNRQRSHQCATIQLDFQLPSRFELEYHDNESNELKRPVIIHRAILGSVERFIAMLAENHLGRWPFWLSPLQAQVVPVHENFNEYAEHVSQEFRKLGFWVDCDLQDARFNAKIRDASLMPYNVVLIVGENEQNERNVTCRIVSNPTMESTKSSKTTKTTPTGTLSSASNIIEEQQHQDEPINREGKSSVHNLRVPLDQLKEHFANFERNHVDRADIELLSLLKCSG